MDITMRCSDLVSRAEVVAEAPNIAEAVGEAVNILNEVKDVLKEFCLSKSSMIREVISKAKTETDFVVSSKSIQYARSNYMEYVEGIKAVLDNGETKPINLKEFIVTDKAFVNGLYDDENNAECSMNISEVVFDLNMIATHDADITMLIGLVKGAYESSRDFSNLIPLVRLCIVSSVRYACITLQQIIGIYEKVYASINSSTTQESANPVEPEKFIVILPDEFQE